VGASQTPPSPALAPPPGNPRFPLFDGLRGLAVLGILAFHASELTGRIGFGLGGEFSEVAGSEAVITFFVISGFLLYRPYAAARADGRPLPSTSRYARRRALRILPGYWTVLTLLAIYPGITGVFTHDWWRYYLYLQVYSQRTEGLGIPVAWTLCIEVTFYLALPLWAFGVRRLQGSELIPLAAVAAGGVAVQCASAARAIAYPIGVSLAGECAWMAIGMALAVVSASVERDERRFAWLQRLAELPELCWGVSAACFLALMALVPAGGLFGLVAAVETRQGVGSSLGKIVLEAVLVAFLVAPVALGRRRRGLPGALLAARPLAYLGVISYSFYLWHLTIVELLARGADPGSFDATGWNLLAHIHSARTPVLFVLALLVTGVVATVSYRLVELPFLRRKEPPSTRPPDRRADGAPILRGR
jgi:peptidoglycan/LPS O-acetylase OafA/YrhL